MRKPFLMVSVAVLTAALPQASRAQGLGPPDSVVRAALARLQPGKGVRLHTAEMGRLEGKFASLTDTTVTLGAAPAETRVALAGIDSLWQRGSAAKTGAAAGAVIGALAGALLMNEFAKSLDETNTSGATLGGGLGGAAAGALLGAAIGAAIPTWHRRVP